MQNTKSLYRGHRFPAIVISCAVRWYYRFQLSLRDIEELLFEHGVVVSYETIRRWCDKFGAGFATTRSGSFGSTVSGLSSGDAVDPRVFMHESRGRNAFSGSLCCGARDSDRTEDVASAKQLVLDPCRDWFARVVTYSSTPRC